MSFTRERGFLGGPGDVEGNREEGGTHGEAPPYGLTAPAGGAAIAMQRYMHLYGATSEHLAAVPISIRQHALNNPRAIMREPLTLEAHQTARMVVDPLRLYDCCLISDGAAVVLVTRRPRARPEAEAGRIAACRVCARGATNSSSRRAGSASISSRKRPLAAGERDLDVYRRRLEREDVAGLLYLRRVLAARAVRARALRLLRSGEAAEFVQDGRIAPGGELPVNTSGGLLSEAHVAGWNSILRDDAAIARHGRPSADRERGASAMGHGLGRFGDLPRDSK